MRTRSGSLAVALLGLVALLCCGTAMAQLPIVASFPSGDAGWSLVGNVQPLSCFGQGCTYQIPDIAGNVTVFPRTIGLGSEPYNNELLQVQSTGQPSYANLLVSVPASGTYTIAVNVLGTQSNSPLGGQSVFPIMNVVVNSSNVNMCHYPNDVGITATAFLTVNNPTVPEYVTTCPVSLLAGNNTIGLQIAGGQAHGGLLTVHHMLVYLASQVSGQVSCYPWQSSQQFTATLSGTTLFDLQNASNNWKNSTCGQSTGTLPAVNLRSGFWNKSAQNCGSLRCALTEMQ